jgi:hypothetical protein
VTSQQLSVVLVSPSCVCCRQEPSCRKQGGAENEEAMMKSVRPLRFLRRFGEGEKGWAAHHVPARRRRREESLKKVTKVDEEVVPSSTTTTSMQGRARSGSSQAVLRCGRQVLKRSFLHPFFLRRKRSILLLHSLPNTATRRNLRTRTPLDGRC